MTFRSIPDMAPLAALLVGILGPAASGCSSRNAEAAAPAASSSDTLAAAARPDVPPRPSSSDSSASASPVAAAADSQWLRYDPATKTATFRLVAGPFDWNGYTGGKATLTVPPGTQTIINFEQNDGTPHSAEIGSGAGPIPNAGGDAAIPRAYTNKVVEGLPQGATDVMRVAATDSGTFRLICGVPGHALSGMWIWYKIDPAAAAPSFGPTPSP